MGGNVIDATIAALICVGVVNPQSSGLGGGFIMTIYNRLRSNFIAPLRMGHSSVFRFLSVAFELFFDIL